MQLGVVDAEPFDLDDDLAHFGQRLGDVGVHETVESAELLQDDRTHALAAWLFTDYRGRRGLGAGR
jgi:hypothetical protein